MTASRRFRAFSTASSGCAPRESASASSQTRRAGPPISSGVPPSSASRALSYDHLVSSGEDAWQALAQRDDPFYRALGRRVFPIGPSRDRSIRDGLDLEPVDQVESADFILNTGPWGEASVADFEDVLRRGAASRVPMACVNPDLVVQLGARLYICAGALAKRYEELGGTVRWHGKPYPSVYERAFALLGISDRRRILAVGDSLRTDIAGANAMGLDAVLIAGGIHAEELGLAESDRPDQARLAAAIAASGARPDAVMAQLSW
jgi:HAD superfamily hydrolase (TIGR01459 family)